MSATAAAAAAATALAALAATTRAHDYLLDVYGPGIFYMACPDAASARAFAAAPVLSDATTYKAGGEEPATGELAVGMLAVHPRACIAVVDVKDDSERATVRYGGGDAFVQRMTLVARETPVTALPAPVPDDHPACIEATALITAALGAVAPTPPPPRRRCVYYMDAREELVAGEAIEEAEFTESIAALRVVAPDGELSGTLRYLETLFASHPVDTHVVAWLKFNDDLDVVWLVPRPPPLTASTLPLTDKE